MIKIVITGTECSGKTTLAKGLAGHYSSLWVPEYARQYLHDLKRAYTQKDLVRIAKRQLLMEQKMIKKANQIIFCDTALYVIKIWSEYKYGSCDKWILNELTHYKADLYLLAHFDIPHEEDALRENRHDRHMLYDIYRNTLIEDKKSFVEIKGNPEERLKIAIAEINDLRLIQI